MKNENLMWKVSSSSQGMRLLAFLANQLSSEEVSNKQIKKAIDLGAVLVNGSVECFSSYVLNDNDEVFLWGDWTKIFDQQSLSLPISYEDQDLWIVDKPSGLEVSEKSFSPFFEEEFFLVHRLDKGTSGVMIVAKTEKMATSLKDLFAKRKVKKQYLALVDNKVIKNQGFIDTSLCKKSSFQGQTLWQTTKARGLSASTHWSLLKSKDNISLLKCSPYTGRTHQIRVHLLSIGHPILGDYLYSKKFRYQKQFIERLMLHSYSVSFVHPNTKKGVKCSSLPPKIFEKIIGPIDL